MKVKLLNDIRPRWSSPGGALLLLALVLLPFTALAQTTELTGSGTSDEPYLISSAADWDAFAAKVSGGETTACAKLTQDISGVSTMIGDFDGGTSKYSYGGTFDGDGHTMTLDITTTSARFAAPFAYVNGATIKNLKVAGTISTNKQYAGSIVGRSDNADNSSNQVTITNCESSVVITSSISGEGTHGGLVGNSDGPISIENSIFSGQINGASTTRCGGFIGWTGQTTKLTNCLLTASFGVSATNSATFTGIKAGASASMVTITNCYYKNALGTVQGTAVTDDQLASGEVAWNLQNGQTIQAWGQTLTGDNKDATPVMTAEASKRVYKVTYQYENGDVLATQFSNATMENLPDAVASKTLTLNGETFSAPTSLSNDVTVTVGEDRTELTPSISDVTLYYSATLTPTVNNLPDDYKGTVTYTSDNESVVSVNGTVLTGKAVGEATITATFAATDTYKSATTTFKVTVSLNKEDIDGEGTEASPYLIKTAKGWNTFAQLVAAGNTKIYAKLANDIGPVSTMVGTSTNYYAGTFDGDGHKLNVNFELSNEGYIAPFRYVNGATIRNLHVAGKVSGFFSTGGLIAYASGSVTTITGCDNDVTISGSESNLGGYVAQSSSNGQVTITNSRFSGAINGGSGSGCGGFIGFALGKVTLANCLMTGSIATRSDSYTFVRRSSRATIAITNCYYKKNALGTVQGTAVTDDQLASGEVAWNLQNGQTTQAWGQTLTGDNKDTNPVQTADASKRVYKVTYQYDDGVVLATQFSNATMENLPDAVTSKTLTLDGETFSAPASLSKDVTVTVGEDRTELTPSINDVTLDWSATGTTLTPTVNGLPDDYKGAVTYTSGNESVVSVNGTVLTGKATGEATITATFTSTDTYKSATTTFKVTVSINKADLDGEGTEASPYIIKTTNGWNAFANLVAAGNTKVYAKLANDIETVSTMACTATNKYAGTFDGQSHTVTVNYNTDQQFAAPFRYVNGATIKNLRVAGTISTSAKNAAGIVGQATTAKSTIENCRSSVAIVSSVNGDGTHGGLVSDVSGGGSVAIKDCIFDGSITGSSTNKCAGFIGWVDNSGSTITNCLQAGTFSINNDGSYTFARARKASNVTVSNSYYLNALGTVNSGATKVTAEQLSSGEVAYKLQNSRSEQAWGQTLTGDNKDATPVPTADASKRVYKVTYQYDDGVVLATQFSNATRDNLPDAVASKTLTLAGEAFTASTTISNDVTVTVGEDLKELTPSISDVTLVWGDTLAPTVNGLPDDYKGTVTYTSDNESVVSVDGNELTGKVPGVATITATFARTDTYKSTTTTFKVTVSPNKEDLDGEGTEASPYIIKTANGWNAFAQLVGAGNNNVYAKLANDLNLSEGTYDGMIGTSGKPYSGTFDGQGHTVTVNYTASQQYVAPFRYISGATIKNLHTAGTFKVSNKFAAGIVASATTSASTIENCQSSVTINSSVNGDGTHGGLVAVVNNDGSIAIKDCIFDGSITGSSTTNCGGLTGWVENSNTGSTITNCLQAGTFSINNDGSYTFARARQASNVTVSNSYYLNALGSVNSGATQVTAEQLSSGEVAYKLQNSRSEQVWGQTVGTDNMPQLTSDEDKHIYNNVFGSENVYDNYVVINEDKDNADNIAANNNGRVKVIRSFAADTWNTLVLPFALTTDEVNTAFGSDAKVAKFTNNTANTIELNYDETGADKAIEANTPVLIRVTTAVSNPTFSSRNISSSDSPQVSGSNGINFIGSYAASYTIQDGEYFISGDKLWKSQGNSTIKATRAYFTVPASQQAKLAFSINGDVVTGIGSIHNSEFTIQNSGAVYNLSGQKVADGLDDHSLPKGIYIVN